MGQGSLLLLLLLVATGPAGGKPAQLLGLGWDVLPGVGASHRGSPASSNLCGCMGKCLQCTPQHPRGGGPAWMGLPSSSGCTGEHQVSARPLEGTGPATVPPRAWLPGAGTGTWHRTGRGQCQSSLGWERGAELPQADLGWG